jgi:hypothetical protein
MNSNLADTMNIDPSIIFALDEQEVILEVDKEEAKQLLEHENPTTSTAQPTKSSQLNIANDLTQGFSSFFVSRPFQNAFKIMRP